MQKHPPAAEPHIFNSNHCPVMNRAIINMARKSWLKEMLKKVTGLLLLMMSSHPAARPSRLPAQKG